MQRGLLCAVLGGVMWMTTGAAQAAHLRAAAAQVDITPPAGTPMWGYARRSGPATGTLDPLMARILVLEAGERRVALVTLDLGRAFGEKAIADLRESVKRSSAVAYVFVTASHTHAGPVIRDAYPAGDMPLWESTALSRIGQAIDDACHQLADARVGTGYGVAYIGHNRLRANPDRTVTWLDRNPTKAPTSPFDPTVAVLRIDVDEKPLAVLVNYACHPVVLGPDNRQFSADYPGAMGKEVQRALGEKTQVMFLQGAAGDINPYYAVTPLEQEAIKYVNWSGAELGREVARVAKSIRPQDEPDAALDFAEDILDFHFRWDPTRFREDMAQIFGPNFDKEFGPGISDPVKAPVAAILINKRIAILGMPGEPFVDFQTAWRTRCPVPDAFLAGYANAYHGYFPTIDEAALNGYGTASVTTWLEPGAGERMVDHGLILIHTMLGRFTNIPYRAKY